jgi:Helix-turn-helix domain
MSPSRLPQVPVPAQLSVCPFSSAAICCRPDLSPQAKALYGILEAYDTRPDHYVVISQDRLAALMRRTTRSVRTYLTELVTAGVIERIRRGMSKPNVYFLSKRKVTSDQDKAQEKEKKAVQQPPVRAAPVDISTDQSQFARELSVVDGLQEHLQVRHHKTRQVFWQVVRTLGVEVTGRCLALTLEAADLGKVKKTLVAYFFGVAKRTALEAGLPWLAHW